MNHWFRFYDDAVNDPKIIKLPDDIFRAWVNLLCVASKNGGTLPAIDDVAIILRVKTTRATAIIAELVSCGLIDETGTGFSPHNWNGRQYRSDVSTDRVKRFRKRERAVPETVPETFHDRFGNGPRLQTTDTDSDRTDVLSGADAPIDHRKRLFNEGLVKLAAMTGKGPDACRSFVGKCLKAASDDAVTVLGLIEDAERNRVVDPSAWIVARLQPTGPPARPLTEFQRKQQEVRDVTANLEAASRRYAGSGAVAEILSPDHSGRPANFCGGDGSAVLPVPRAPDGRSH